MTAALAIRQRSVGTSASEGRELFKFLEARIDLLASEGAEAVYTEALAAEAAHHGTVDYGAAEFVRVDVFRTQVHTGARQRSHKSAREAVARTGGIEDIFQ